MIFLLGDILNAFEGEGGSLTEAIKPTILTFVGVGIAAWILTYVYYIFLVILAQRIGRKTKVAYFRSIL